MGRGTLRYRPLEGEPAYHQRQPIALVLPLAALRLVATVFLALLRLTVTSVLALLIAVVLLEVGLVAVGRRAPAVGDANEYLSSVLRASAGWLDDPTQLPEETNTLIRETSSTSAVRPTPVPGSATSLVETLSQFAPSELRRVYEQAVPMMQQYDAFLGDVQSALQNERDLDAFFAHVQPWLQQAEAEAGSAQP